MEGFGRRHPRVLQLVPVLTMYPEVESILDSVIATDGDFLPLCRDCRGYAAAHGEREGLAFARMLLKCAQQWVEYKKEKAKWGKWSSIELRSA